MKNYKVTYNNGQLIDAETKLQIHLIPGEVFYINGNANAFLEQSDLKDNDNILSEEEMLILVTKKYNGVLHERILKAGTKLYFRIGLGKATKEDKSNEYLFEAILLEDLYIRSKEGVKWRLCDCKCKTEKVIQGSLPFTHEIKGSSLNSLFSNVVIHYFSYKRATTCNVFNTYALPKDTDTINLSWIKRRNTIFLNDLRMIAERKFMSELNNSK